MDLDELVDVSCGCGYGSFGAWVESAIWVASLRCEERGMAVRRVNRVVVRELRDLQVLDLVRLVVIHVEAKVRLKLLVVTLHKTVCLRVISR